MHDPMAMRPFLGYNFGHYLDHWLSLEKEGRQMPKIFHVNWFRRDQEGGFLWPGFGENIRVLEWICRRVDDEDLGVMSAVGVLPRPGSVDLKGLLEEVDWQKLFSLPRDFWIAEVEELKGWLDQELSVDMPDVIREQMLLLEQRVKNLPE